MAHILAARVGAMSTTTGTGNLAFSAALTAHRAFDDVLPNGSTTEYLAYAINTSGAASGQWEVGIGTYYNAGDAGGERLERTTVHETSENDTAKVDFVAGDKVVVISPLASRLTSIPVADSTSHLRSMHYDEATGRMYWAGVPYAPLLPNPNPGSPMAIYVDATLGDDANSGLSNLVPLQSLDGAFMRAMSYRLEDAGAIIYLKAGDYYTSQISSPDPIDYELGIQVIGEGAANTSIHSLVCANGFVNLAISGVKVRDSVTVSKASFEDCTFDQTGESGSNYHQIQAVRPRDAFNREHGRGSVSVSRCTFAGSSGCRVSLQKFCDGSLSNITWASGSASYGAVMEIADHCTMSVDGGTGASTGKRAAVGHFSVVKTFGPGSGVETFLRGDTAATFGHASAVV